METNNTNLIQCKFGIYCKFGLHCKFYHPQRFTYQTYSPNPHHQFQIYQLGQQFEVINFNSSSISNTNHNSNQYFTNDAQQQQYLHQQSSTKQQNCHKLTSQPKVKEKHKKILQNSSDSNSDMQSDSEEDKKHKKHKYQQEKEKNNQKLNYLYGQDKIKKQNKKAFYQQHSKKSIDQQSYYLYHTAFSSFFEKRHIKIQKRQGIVKFLAKQIKYDQTTVQTITSMIEELEKDGFLAHCCYKKFFKTIVKENFEIEAVKTKLYKKINIEKKKKTKDAEFNLRFPSPAQIQFLQNFELLQNHYHSKDTIYLIDGNNCLTTQKHLRYFFQQKDQKSKAEAQIRFRWLISQVIRDQKRCFVFFDDKFDKKIYEEIMDRLMSQEEENKMIESMTVIYGDSGKEADELIRNKMIQLKQTLPAQLLRNIILVTADRILTQQCYMIHPLKKSSGMYLVKFFKKFLKKQAKLNQSLKKIIKKILNYGD